MINCSSSTATLLLRQGQGRSVKEALTGQACVHDIAGGLSLPAIAQYLSVWDIAHATVLNPEARDTPRWLLTENQ